MPQHPPVYAEIIAVMGRHVNEGVEMEKLRASAMTLIEEWPLSLAFLFSILSGFGLHHWYSSYCPLHESVMALADAFMVAGILGLALEVFATKHLIEKASTRLAKEMIGGGLSPNIKTKIYEIATTKLARHGYKKEYRLKEATDGTLTVETTTSFKIENYGEKTEKYTPEADEEKVFNPRFLYLEYSLLGRKYSFDENALAKSHKGKHGTGTTIQASGRRISIPPRTKELNAVCEVKWVIEVTMKGDWFDLTEFRYPTEDAEIYLAEKPDQLEFYCTGKTIDSKTWTFDEPFMVGQQLKVWWAKKQA